ncbi:MAG TPA: hypothetical protein VF559_05195 [Caulobacteraceae bacterium]|jgi:hypothetical protein
MDQPPPKPPGKRAEDQLGEDKLAQALRANLRRRKAAAKAAKPSAEPPER